MHFARMKYKYLYDMQKYPTDWDRWPRDGNIGDCIQNLAVENLYRELGISDETLLKINRDEIPFYNGDKCILPMQAWFGNYAGTFPLPWSSQIEPVFIGFHLNKGWQTRERFLREKIQERMEPFQPIGCRDRNTRDFLISLGLDAYFSGCMTLTFPKRESNPENGKIFVVDITDTTKNILPEHIKQQADYSITHFYYYNQYPVTEEGALLFENQARKILARYKNEAKLVITSKIHCAMPCIAMGIPVIFIHEENNVNERFDVLKGIVPLYSPYEPYEIDWNPAAVNIDDLKIAIKENAFFRISKAAEKFGLPLNKTYNSSDEKQIRDNMETITNKLISQVEVKKFKTVNEIKKKCPFKKFFISLIPFTKLRRKLRNKYC